MQRLPFLLLALCVLASTLTLAQAKEAPHAPSAEWLAPGSAPPHSRSHAAKLSSSRDLALLGDEVEGFQFQSPQSGDVLTHGSQVPVFYSGGLPDWKVNIGLIDVDGWKVAGGLVESWPNAAGQFVWTVGSQWALNYSSNFQLYIAETNNKMWHYGPTFRLTEKPSFTLLQPAKGAVLPRGSPVEIAWTGGLRQWDVSLSLISLKRWAVARNVGSTPNRAGSFTWTLPLDLDCEKEGAEFQFYLSDRNTTEWTYGPVFLLEGC